MLVVRASCNMSCEILWTTWTKLWFTHDHPFQREISRRTQEHRNNKGI